MEQLAGNLWVFRYDLGLMGLPIGRTVVVLRLASKGLVIHSTGPFTVSDTAAIRDLGDPLWLVEATRFHNTFAREGSFAFPGTPYLVPSGFTAGDAVSTQPLLPTPPEWAGEIEVLCLGGMPAVNEHVMLHRPSRTLIVADLVFNWRAERGWRSWLRGQLTGVRGGPGMSRLYRRMIRDRVAFAASAREMMEWDFDRVIPAHGEIIVEGGKEQLRGALHRAGCDV